MADVVLKYGRAVETYSGDIDGSPFFGKSFASMMTLVHIRLREVPGAGLMLQRTERPGLLPIHIDPGLVELLREDPARYIKMHTVAPVRLDLTGKGKRRLAQGERADIPKTSGIRAGHDTVAEAFGPVVYARMRNGNVESPETGRWISPHELESQLDAALELVNVTPVLGWVGIRISDLLRTKIARFYLPREWNPYRSWISRGQLSELLEQFEEEKVALCQSAETPTTS